MKSSDEYFKDAADKGYVYAINNEAISHANNAFEKHDEKEEYVKKYIEAMGRSADKYEPWACVELGHFYRTGIIEKRRNDTLARTGDTLTFPEYINLDKARDYYLRASEFMLDKNSGWACYNILCYYQDWVIANGKRGELVDKIKQTEAPEIIGKTEVLLREKYSMFFHTTSIDPPTLDDYTRENK